MVQGWGLSIHVWRCLQCHCQLVLLAEFHWGIVCGKKEYVYSFIFCISIRNFCPCLFLVLVSEGIISSFGIWAISSTILYSIVNLVFSCLVSFSILILGSFWSYCNILSSLAWQILLPFFELFQDWICLLFYVDPMLHMHILILQCTCKGRPLLLAISHSLLKGKLHIKDNFCSGIVYNILYDIKMIFYTFWINLAVILTICSRNLRHVPKMSLFVMPTVLPVPLFDCYVII